MTRRLVRALIPRAMRQFVRTVASELPTVLRDAVDDIRDRSLPGPIRRFRVGGTTSRTQFLQVGQRGAEELMWAMPRPITNDDVVLDLGCGSGRIARHFGFVEHFYGVDIDASAIRWCQSHLHGTYEVRGTPPDGVAFTFIYAVSVFTHMDEREQDAMLEAVHGALAPDGILIVTLHNPEHVHVRGVALNEEGFAFVAGSGPFNENSAFHDVRYLSAHWSRWFELVRHVPFGFVGFHDLAVLRRLH